MQPYEKLALAIVIDAIKDYKKALRSANRLLHVGSKYSVVEELKMLLHYYENQRCYEQVKKCAELISSIEYYEQLFRSEWFYFLSPCNFDVIMKEVQRQCLK